jgi:hypothetical protein
MPRIAELFDKSPSKMPFDFPDILAAIAPRPVFINAPIHDSNFDVTGVRECVRKALPAFNNRDDLLVAVHPDAAHDFAPDIRTQAYQFLHRWLRE